MATEDSNLQDRVMLQRRNSFSYVTRFGSTVKTVKQREVHAVTTEATQTDLDAEMTKGFLLLKQILLELTNRRML